jgi:hypothetical protein
MEIGLFLVASLFLYLIYEISKRIGSLLGHMKRPTYLIRKDPNEDFLDFSFHNNTEPNDITSYRTTKEIVESGIYTPDERRREYVRRGKSPSGVINGEYNDTFLEDDETYNNTNRDWDADD